MPSIDNVLDVATNLSLFRNIDTSEMFHNYNMLERLQPYAGVDMTWADKRMQLIGKYGPGWKWA